MIARRCTTCQLLEAGAASFNLVAWLSVAIVMSWPAWLLWLAVSR